MENLAKLDNHSFVELGRVHFPSLLHPALCCVHLASLR